MSARIEFYKSAFCIKEIFTHLKEQTCFYDSKKHVQLEFVNSRKTKMIQKVLKKKKIAIG